VEATQDAYALSRRVGAVQLAAQHRTLVVDGDQLAQLLERHAEQVAHPQQLPQALDVLLVVETVLTGRAALRRRQQPLLLVVADRARRRADEPRDVADPQQRGGRTHRCAPCRGRSIETNAPSSETPASTHSAVCMLAMNGSSWCAVRPEASPEKILKRTSLGTAAVMIASTNAIDRIAPVFWSIRRAPAAIPRRCGGTVPIIAAVFGELNMPEPM